MITGSKKETKQFDNKKYIGFFKGRVKLVSPSRDELNELFSLEGKDDDKEIEYTGEKEGVDTARIVFWMDVEGMRDVYLTYNISLKNEIRRNKAGDKIQLVNQVGDNTWVEADNDDSYDDSGLFDNFKGFTKVNMWKLPNGEESEKWQRGAKPAPGAVEVIADKKFRAALVGESDLLDFLKVWLNRLEFKKDPETNILLDMDKLFSGDFSDLTSQIGGDFDDIPFVGLAYVQVDEEDSEKQYQKVYRHFLPGNMMKFIKNGMNFGTDKFAQDTWNKFMAEVEGDYPPQGDFILEPLREYDPATDVATSDKTKAEEVKKSSTSKYD